MRFWFRLRTDIVATKTLLRPKIREMRTSSYLFSPITLNAPVEIPHISTQDTIIPLITDENNETIREMRNALDVILNHPQLIMKDRASVEKKLKQIISGGPDKLMVISDFDYTLSRSEDTDGNKCWTTHGVFDNGADSIYPGLGDKFKVLKRKYYPIEFDPTLSMEEKTPYMEKWWNTSHNYIVEARFNKSTIENFVRNSKISLRDQTENWMLRLRDLGVPLVVFSAGIGNVIEMFFQQKFGKMLTNIHIISNMMIFNNEDVVESFSEPLIHTFCKNSSVIKKDAGFFHDVNKRTNVILMGDSMGDIHMDVGVEKEGPTLKIGFLNGDVDNLLEHYMDGYDIVLIKDQTMHIPSLILQAISASKIDGA